MTAENTDTPDNSEQDPGMRARDRTVGRWSRQVRWCVLEDLIIVNWSEVGSARLGVEDTCRIAKFTEPQPGLAHAHDQAPSGAFSFGPGRR
jgi:hypothetical protein